MVKVVSTYHKFIITHDFASMTFFENFSPKGITFQKKWIVFEKIYTIICAIKISIVFSAYTHFVDHKWTTRSVIPISYWPFYLALMSKLKYLKVKNYIS